MRYSKFILDLDGVVYRGDKPIEGAVDTINDLQRRGKVMFLSNNPTDSRATLVEKLSEMGIVVQKNEVVNCACVTAHHIRKIKEGARIFVVGEQGLRDELGKSEHRLVGPEEAEFLVVGLDRKITYDKLTGALRALLNGARFIVTDMTPVCPIEDKLVPAAGSTVGAIKGMDFKPEFDAGKPSKDAVLEAMEIAGIEKTKECLLIGDNLEFDIQAAKNISIDSVLVLTGVSKKEDIERTDIRPTFVLEKLSDLNQIVE